MAVAYAPVKCEAQKRILHAGVGNALGADKHDRGDAGIVVQGVVNLAANLPAGARRPSSNQSRASDSDRHTPRLYTTPRYFFFSSTNTVSPAFGTP